MQTRQGDIFIESIKAVPKGKNVKKRASKIVAYGEVTGHCHQIEGDVELWEDERAIYVQAKDEFNLVHDEHSKITYPAGTYEFVRQREYDPMAADMERKVLD